MQLDVNKYPYVDLSKMFDIPGCAVRVPTRYAAETILANFMTQHPNEEGYHMSDTNWDSYESNTAYTLWSVFCGRDGRPNMRITSLGYTSVDWFKDSGYTVIEFEELMELPDLDDGDLPLEFLIS